MFPVDNGKMEKYCEEVRGKLFHQTSVVDIEITVCGDFMRMRTY